MREDLPEDLTAELVEEEIRGHSDTRHAIDKEYAETVAMGKALIDRMELPPVYGEDGAPNRPPHLLEESLMDLEERKMAWERIWQDRDDRLRHWLKLGDYEQQMREVNDARTFKLCLTLPQTNSVLTQSKPNWGGTGWEARWPNG